MGPWEGFSGVNRGNVLKLYERFRTDPASVDAASRAIFEQWTPPQDADAASISSDGVPVQVAVGAVNLAQSIRRYGHLAAQLDPLGAKPLGDPSLLPDTHGVTEADLRRVPANLVPSPLGEHAASMQDLVDAFRRLYCSTSGYDFSHIFVPEERNWLRQAVE